jgi:hypothetical protein
MIVFQINAANLVIGIDHECQPSVGCYAEAPGAFPIARQRVGLPGRQRTQFIRAFDLVEISQHLAEFVHRITWHAPYTFIFIEPLQALVGETPYLHRGIVACSLTLIKFARREFGTPLNVR